MPRLAIFDFDGTLADTFPWFLSVLNPVARRYGFREVANDEVETLRSLSAREIVARLEVPLWKMPMIARHIRALARAEGERLKLFDGVPAMLRRLDGAGVTLAVVTSNSADNVRRVLGEEAKLIRHHGCGASIFGKAAKLRRVLRDAGVSAHDALAVGDEVRDAEAAEATGIPFAAVAWGYTRPEALRDLAPAYLFHTPAELADALAPEAAPSRLSAG